MSLTTDLKVESKERVLTATVAGQASLSEAIRVFTNACDVATERGLERILVDCSLVEGALSTMDRYELGRTLADHCNIRCTASKIAAVGKVPVINGFAARVASNRGLVVETFSELQKAMDWLKGFGPQVTAPTSS